MVSYWCKTLRGLGQFALECIYLYLTVLFSHSYSVFGMKKISLLVPQATISEQILAESLCVPWGFKCSIIFLRSSKRLRFVSFFFVVFVRRRSKCWSDYDLDSAGQGTPWDPPRRDGGGVLGEGSLSFPAYTAAPMTNGWMDGNMSSGPEEAVSSNHSHLIQTIEVLTFYQWLAVVTTIVSMNKLLSFAIPQLLLLAATQLFSADSARSLLTIQTAGNNSDLAAEHSRAFSSIRGW